MTIDLMREILGWCLVMNMGIMLALVARFVFAHDWMYPFHAGEDRTFCGFGGRSRRQGVGKSGCMSHWCVLERCLLCYAKGCKRVKIGVRIKK